MIVLNNDQQDKLVEQFVEIQVDNMDTQSLVDWVTDELINQYGKLTKEELKERVNCYDDNDGLFEELVDNVTNEIAPDKVIITDDDYDTFSDKVVTCEELEEQSIKHYDDDKLCDELFVICDKIVEELAPPKVTITDDDYADKVDTFVGNMGASDDNVFTHDSEGC